MLVTGSRERLRVAAVGGTLLFVSILLLEHFVDSGRDPATHEISEYVHGPAPALMVLGFVAWAASLAASMLLVLRAPDGTPVALALGLAALGIGLTAIFATQTSAGRLPPGVSLDTTGRLHDIGSGIATIALLVASLLSLRLSERTLNRATLLLLAIGPDVAGVRQRLLIAAACTWQLLLLRALAAGPRMTVDVMPRASRPGPSAPGSPRSRDSRASHPSAGSVPSPSGKAGRRVGKQGGAGS